VVAENGMRYKMEVLDKHKKVLLSHYDARGRAFELPFTPPKDGTYIVKLIGIQHFGDYSLSLKQYTTAEALTGKANVIGLDQAVEGKLASQAIAEYHFKGNGNSPLIISGAVAENGMRYKMEVLDKRKKVLLSHYDARGRAFELPFTPPKDGTYTVKLTGIQHFGDYSLSLKQFTTAEALTGKANVLQLDQTVEGLIAYQAIAKYQFKGLKNSALVISGAAAENGMRYKLEVLDKRNKVLLSHYDARGRAFDKPFTPPKDGDYTLKLTGIKHFGDYSLTIGKP